MSAAGHETELGSFLRAMRNRVRPEEIGLPVAGRRRTPGLRRQEVAELAAVSIDWYIRLEQGRVGAPGSAVLDGIADALRLSPVERTHLHLIARGEAPPPVRTPAAVRPSLRVILEGLVALPGYVVDHRFDVLAHNEAAAALFGAGFGTGLAANTARTLFLDPAVRCSHLNWDRIARETVGNLRVNLARYPADAGLRALIGELNAASAEFATWWGDHTVRERAHGTKTIRHPEAGELTVAYDNFAAQDDSGQSLVVVTPVDEIATAALHTLIAARRAAVHLSAAG
ncbi:helix-turn-helix transcriptional regulator [Nocardia sp. BMG111209]|uniref:helix-turn-helix transcriptional regulator n=1 Tax=Nocardia sp. BMG111209 TaxID=1160137 RepID=UPI000381A1F8|nr:helix-turn-helix transcriptional regulator [Nocardia sp. BMG111209]